MLDYHFTASIEEEFDDIAEGEKEWNGMVGNFYEQFHPKIETLKESKERVSGERELGLDPKSGLPVFARIGKYGPLVQKGVTPEEGDDSAEKPSFASILSKFSLETITLEQALECFKLPRDVGEFEGEEVVAGIGRFGPYVRHKGQFTSIKGMDALTITFEEAVKKIEEKREADKNKIIQEYLDEDPAIQVLNGPYGPYIKAGKKNVRIPKSKDPKSLSLEEIKEMVEKAPEKKGRGKKKAKPKGKK